MKDSQDLWDQYWGEYITKKPDIVFLLEEYGSSKNRLFYKRKNDYSSFFIT